MQMLIPFYLFLPLLASSRYVSIYYDMSMVSEAFYAKVGSLYITSRLVNDTYVNVTIYFSNYFTDVYMHRSFLLRRENLTIDTIIAKTHLKCRRFAAATLFKRPMTVTAYVCEANGTRVTLFYGNNIIYKEVIKYRGPGRLWVAILDLRYLEVR